MRRFTLRKVSYLALASAVIVPAAWAYHESMAFDAVVPAPRCGMPILWIWLTALIGVAALTIGAAGFNLASFLRLASPRSRLRKFELVAFLIPATAALALVVSMFIT